MYLTYDEYVIYGGTLDETAYEAIEFEAQAILNWITFNRLRNEPSYSDEVKRCIYDLINLITMKRNALLSTGGNNSDSTIARMENDGVAITYNTMSAADLFEKIHVDANRIVVRYLSGVKNSEGKLLTYRGLYADE